MCNTCNSCNNGCGNNGNNGNTGCGCGCDVLLNTLKNLFAPIGGCGCNNGCGCRNCPGGTLYLVNNLGTLPIQTGTGCGCNNGNTGCGCGCNRQTADAYYVRQYALCGCNG